MEANDDTGIQRFPWQNSEYGTPFSGRACTVVPNAKFSDELVELGRLPDMASWLPADVILMSLRDGGGMKTAAVRAAQRSLGYADEHAEWTHAALYVGNGKILHVNWRMLGTQNHVVRLPVSNFIPGAFIRRRTRPSLTADVRAAIVARAFTLMGKEYSLLRGISVLRRRARLAQPQVTKAESLRIVCSDVVAHAYDFVLDRVVFRDEGQASVLPATLSATGFLDEGDLSWCSIRK